MNVFIKILDEVDVECRFLAEATNKSERIWRICLKCVIGGYFVNETAATLTSVLHCYYLGGEFNVEFLYFPIKWT